MEVLNQQGELIKIDTGFQFADNFFSLLNFIKQPCLDDDSRSTCESQCELFYLDIMNYEFVDSHNQLLSDGHLQLVAKNLNEINRLSIDPLTGLKKKEYLNRKLLSLENKVYLEEIKDFSMIMCDLDKFKSINDEFGHSVGDDTLALFGKLVLNTLRPSDFAYRFGGEEFLIVLPNTHLDNALLVAERLRSVIEEHLQIGHYGLNQITAYDLPKSVIDAEGSGINDAFFLAKDVTASFGVASYADCAQSIELLFDNVDKNLYTSKHKGRNRVSG